MFNDVHIGTVHRTSIFVFYAYYFIIIAGVIYIRDPSFAALRNPSKHLFIVRNKSWNYQYPLFGILKHFLKIRSEKEKKQLGKNKRSQVGIPGSSASSYIIENHPGARALPSKLIL